MPSFDIVRVAPADITKGLNSAVFGELHQLYVDPKYQDLRIGKTLFEIAADHLAARGCEQMFINTMSVNGGTEFYQQRGSVLVAQVVEHNLRGGNVRDNTKGRAHPVSCDYLVYSLQ
jgi:ribosomal protein S18 acetylase RimI-like enzyme